MIPWWWRYVFLFHIINNADQKCLINNFGMKFSICYNLFQSYFGSITLISYHWWLLLRRVYVTCVLFTQRVSFSCFVSKLIKIHKLTKKQSITKLMAGELIIHDFRINLLYVIICCAWKVIKLLYLVFRYYLVLSGVFS